MFRGQRIRRAGVHCVTGEYLEDDLDLIDDQERGSDNRRIISGHSAVFGADNISDGRTSSELRGELQKPNSRHISKRAA